MLKVSVIIPTCNRPDLLPRAIKSVLSQIYQDFEIIVVDDGDKRSAENVVRQFNDERIKYIKHVERKGGAAARNTGIKAAQGEFIAFLDDDDEWLPKKLEIQMRQFENTPNDVGFCFSAIININADGEKASEVPDGIGNYLELSLRRFKGFMTSTLIIKKYVFDKAGFFDEMFPSHQEPDLIIRIAKNFKGLGVNQPLVKMDMIGAHEHIGSSLERRIGGGKMILNKHLEEFKKRPEVLAKHYFQIALWHRDNKQFVEAEAYFKKAWKESFRLRYFYHYLSAFIFTKFLH